MKNETLEQLKYPIGQFDKSKPVTAEDYKGFVQEIAALPAKLRLAVTDLAPAQLDTPYRPGGWTVRQVIHHLPDSHLNAYTRLKLALTEENPVIRPYDEVAWANLPDSLTGAPELSLQLLDGIHKRWVVLLQSLKPEQLNRTFIHPTGGSSTLWQHTGNYAWHGTHHLAHITELKKRLQW